MAAAKGVIRVRYKSLFVVVYAHEHLCFLLLLQSFADCG